MTPNHVVTAAHCVDTAVPGGVLFRATVAGTSAAHDVVGVVACALNPGYVAAWGTRALRPGVSTPTEACGSLRPEVVRREEPPSRASDGDYAILTLERPIPRAFEPTAPGAWARAAQINRETRSGNIEVTAVGYSTGARLFSPLSIAYSEPSMFQTTGFGLLDPGDSGGPLLLETAPRTLIGVASFVEIGRRRTDVWTTMTPAARAWLDEHSDIDGDGLVDLECGGARRGIDASLTLAEDADNDWVDDAVDTCPGIYNPCQIAIDSDGDDLTDDCDACPSLDSVALPRYAAALVDGDVDGLPDACDCTGAFFTLMTDADADGVWGCDNCSSDPNPLQEDCNSNLQGDACEDADVDGVLDVCGLLDNCPTIRNPDQRNCNRDAELASDITNGPGDVCDPNPCPDGTMGIVAREFVRSDSTEPPTPVASSAAFAGTGRQTSANGSYDTPTGIRTSLRWCPCADAVGDDAEAREACRSPAPARCEIDFARLDIPPDDGWGWRVPTVQYPGAGSAGLDLHLGHAGRRRTAELVHRALRPAGCARAARRQPL